MADIAFHKIPIYDFPIDPEQDDAETIQENTELRVSFTFRTRLIREAMLPFAVIGSD